MEYTPDFKSKKRKKEKKFTLEMQKKQKKKFHFFRTWQSHCHVSELLRPLRTAWELTALQGAQISSNDS